MTTKIFVNGRSTATPGAYSETDFSRLDGGGLGPVGVVALVGTSLGGRPVSSITNPDDIPSATTSAAAQRLVRSGDLKEAIPMVFAPSTDPAVPGGASRVYLFKVDPATQAELTLSDGNGTSLLLKTSDYGDLNDTTAQVSAGTTTGKAYSFVQGSVSETFDNVGGVAKFTLNYVPPSGNGGWETMRAQVLASGVRLRGTRTDVGKAADIANAATSGEVVRVEATSADVGKTVTIYGLTVGGAPVSETLTLINGAVLGAQLWGSVAGAKLSAAAGGTITISRNDSPTFTAIITFSATNTEKGMVSVSAMYVSGSKLALTDGASSATVIVLGRNTSGATVLEKVTLSGGAAYTRTSGLFLEVHALILGAVSGSNTVTVAGEAAKTTHTVQRTLAELKAFFDARRISSTSGFQCAITGTNTSFATSDLDYTSGTGTDVYNTVGSFYSNLADAISTITSSSELVDASRIAFVAKARTLTFSAPSSGSATYTITINAAAVTFSTSSTDAAVVQAGIIEAILASPTNAALVNATADGANIALTALTPSGFTITVGVTGTGAALAVTGSTETAGTGAAPSNTAGPVFFAGGAEGTATFSNWAAAFELAKRIRVNHIVPLTGDPGVHAAAAAYRLSQVGKNEVEVVVGLSALDGNSNPTGAVPTKTSIKTQIAAINYEGVRACAQTVTRRNTQNVLTDFAPWFQAAIVAGMQSGVAVGDSLADKTVSVTDVDQSSTWDPVLNSDEMIEAGLCFMVRDEQGVIRVVRNNTTKLGTENVALIEASIQYNLGLVAYDLRKSLRPIVVGKGGTPIRLKAVTNRARTEFERQIGLGRIVGFRNVTLTSVGDALYIDAEIRPTIAWNFLLIRLAVVADDNAVVQL